MMSEKICVALTGYPGAGKTITSSYLENEYGFTPLSGSGVLDELASRQGKILSTRADYNQFFDQTSARLGEDFLAAETLATPKDRVAYDGIRTRADVFRFQRNGGIILGLISYLPTRFNRTAGTDPKYPIDLDEFQRAEMAEDKGKLRVAHALMVANHVIVNESSIQELHSRIDKVIGLYV